MDAFLVLSMNAKMLRAVVRGIDAAPKRTEWLPAESPQLMEMLIAILPPPGENFMVTWETRDDNNQTASA